MTACGFTVHISLQYLGSAWLGMVWEWVWLLIGNDALSLAELDIQALVTAARAEKSTTVQRSYAQAAASVARYASEARMAKLVEEAVTMYTLPGQICEMDS